jgi:primosomal protein N' (replication factor Y) (superfamily II helicase)
VVRLDRDIASRKGGHGLAMDSFLGQGGILLGTQMIAKGHDIPDVTLVGVTDSDIGAGMPDFRAAERTFQLLCQVAGRAGRADLPGLAILQTRRPTDPLLHDVLAHDYGAFAERELETRRILSLPPFARMVLVEASSEDQAAAERWIGALASRLRPIAATFGGAAMGPLPAPVAVVAKRHRMHLLCKSSPERAGDLRRRVLDALVAHPPPANVRAFADIDPVDVM